MEDQNQGTIYEFHPDTEEIILCRYISLVDHFRRITNKASLKEDREDSKKHMASILDIPDDELNGLKALALQAVHEKKQESTSIN